MTEAPTDDIISPEPSGATPRSWWTRFTPHTPTETTIGVLALAFFAGALGYLIGVNDSNDAPAAESADAGFLYDMSVHHEQALQLSMIQLVNGSDPTVQSFAREILRAQAYEIGLMRMRLGSWGLDPADPPDLAMTWMGMGVARAEMPGMASASEMEAFRGAEGAEADALFLALMRDHHAGGIAMAQGAADRASNEWVVDTAARMATIQSGEIVELELARQVAGLPKEPEGFTPDFDSVGMQMGSDDG